MKLCQPMQVNLHVPVEVDVLVAYIYPLCMDIDVLKYMFKAIGETGMDLPVKGRITSFEIFTVSKV